MGRPDGQVTRAPRADLGRGTVLMPSRSRIYITPKTTPRFAPLALRQAAVDQEKFKELLESGVAQAASN